MSKPTFIVEYAYLQLHQWTERRGDTIVHLCRADKYHTFTGELLKRGDPSDTAVVHLNGWEPLAPSRGGGDE